LGVIEVIKYILDPNKEKYKQMKREEKIKLPLYYFQWYGNIAINDYNYAGVELEKPLGPQTSLTVFLFLFILFFIYLFCSVLLDMEYY
jgi:hypothetical protein